MLTITIKYIPRGWASHRLTLYDDGLFVADADYMYCSKREMLRDFKELTEIKGKHNVKILDYTSKRGI